MQIRKRHEVHLITLNQKKLRSTQQVYHEALTVLEKMCKRVDVFPIKSDRSKWRWAAMTASSYFGSFPYDVNWLRNDEMALFIERIARKETYDLIHIDTIGMYPYANAFFNVAQVLNHHNIESHMMARRVDKEKQPLKRIYFRKEAKKLVNYERAICPKCVMNLVVSDLDGLRLKEHVGDIAVTVVPNGVDLEYFQPVDFADGQKEGLVFAGAMNYYPNREAVLFFLSEIWPLLKKDNPNRAATFVGIDPPRELLDAARQSRIFAPGFVDDVRPYIDAAKIYICPIRDGGGTRLKILDALAMGKPLVATELAVEGLGLVEGEHYLRADNASEFVTQIKRLENDGNLYHKLSESGRSFVKDRYSWETIGRNIEEAYNSAIDLFKRK